MLLVSKIVVQGNIFKQGTKLSMVTFDCVFLTQESADTTWECENEPNPEVFQEVKIYSCVEVAVRNGLHFVAQLDSSFRNATLEQNEDWS